MTEDEREELIYQLVEEFQKSIGNAFNDEKKYSFIAGARAALVTIEETLKVQEKDALNAELIKNGERFLDAMSGRSSDDEIDSFHR